MNPFYQYREALRTAIVDANIGLAAEAILIDRQMNVFNEISTALNLAKNGVVLVIQVPEGKRREDASELDFDCTLTLNLVAKPMHLPSLPNQEEAIFVKLLKAVEGLKLSATGGLWNHCHFALRVQGFGEIEDPQNRFLIRQVICRQRLFIS